MKKRILCFGDSNTWGFIAGSNFERHDENTRWPCVMQKELGEDYAVIEEGYNGRTTVWHDPVENRMCGADYFPACIDTHSPLDAVIIMLGTNDTKCYFSVNAANIAASAARIAQMAMDSPYGPVFGKAPKVLLVSPVLIKDPKFAGMFDEVSEKISQGFAEAYKCQAEAIGCEFFDAASVASPDPDDGIHMSKESQKALGKALAEKIKTMI